MQALATSFQWSHFLSDALSTVESVLHGIDVVDMTLVTWSSASNGCLQDLEDSSPSQLSILNFCLGGPSYRGKSKKDPSI